MAALRGYWPQISATIQVGSPLLWGAICAAETRRGAMNGRRAWLPLVLLFPLLWARGTVIPGPLPWAAPFAFWTAALVSVRSRRHVLRAALLLATGASTAAVQLWQLNQTSPLTTPSATVGEPPRVGDGSPQQHF